MERLTYWCNDGRGGGEYRVNENAAEYSGPFVDRLAAYEDTGLEPEEISYCLNGSITVEKAKVRYNEAIKQYDEWFAWKQAEAEGRLIVLPCKVGEPCFRVYSCRCGCRERCKKKKEAKLVDVVPYPCGYAYYCKRIAESKFTLKYIADFGKTVFRTREEAEKALEGMGNDYD